MYCGKKVGTSALRCVIFKHRGGPQDHYRLTDKTDPTDLTDTTALTRNLGRLLRPDQIIG